MVFIPDWNHLFLGLSEVTIFWKNRHLSFFLPDMVLILGWVPTSRVKYRLLHGTIYAYFGRSLQISVSTWDNMKRFVLILGGSLQIGTNISYHMGQSVSWMGFYAHFWLIFGWVSTNNDKYQLVYWTDCRGAGWYFKIWQKMSLNNPRVLHLVPDPPATPVMRLQYYYHMIIPPIPLHIIPSYQQEILIRMQLCKYV